MAQGRCWRAECSEARLIDIVQWAGSKRREGVHDGVQNGQMACIAMAWTGVFGVCIWLGHLQKLSMRYHGATRDEEWG